jgi:hypothetical protein
MGLHGLLQGYLYFLYANAARTLQETHLWVSTTSMWIALHCLLLACTHSQYIMTDIRMKSSYVIPVLVLLLAAYCKCGYTTQIWRRAEKLAPIIVFREIHE